jgi:hypothetical protein
MGTSDQNNKPNLSDFILNEDQSPLERRADELRAEIQGADLKHLAGVTGAQLRDEEENPVFEFLYWGNPVILSSSDYIARDQESNLPLPAIHQAMILYYFSTSKGSSASGKWISFSELADGQFYNAAFQGYTSRKLLAHFKQNYGNFEQRCRDLCGEKISFGDGAYRYQILPRVSILVVYWKGDDEFPPSYKILFEDIVDYHLPTDGCAILASMLTGKLIRD